MPRLAVTSPADSRSRTENIEWPTWGLLLTIYSTWLLLNLTHACIGPWLFTGLLAVLVAWFMSLQHELAHGHPTRSERINRWLGLAPLSLWYPFDLYRLNHLAHHNDLLLTRPGVDTESNYRHARDVVSACHRSLHGHRPAAQPDHRIVINEPAWPWRLLYLNNNYHAVHHAEPGVPWYRIPALYRADRAFYLRRNGGFLIPGYGWLMRRHLWRPIDSPIWPGLA